MQCDEATMRYTTLLFDLDGTLTDPYDGITRCVQFALARQGIEVVTGAAWPALPTRP